MGRPKIYSDEDYELFEKQVLDYIKLCEENEEPITISGLAVYMRIGRTTLWRYAERDKFKDLIDFFKERVVMCLENETLKGNLNPTMAIFSLKNNCGWTDKVQSVNENKNTNANIDCSKLTDEQIDKILKGE